MSATEELIQFNARVKPPLASRLKAYAALRKMTIPQLFEYLASLDPHIAALPVPKEEPCEPEKTETRVGAVEG